MKDITQDGTRRSFAGFDPGATAWFEEGEALTHSGGYLVYETPPSRLRRLASTSTLRAGTVAACAVTLGWLALS